MAGFNSDQILLRKSQFCSDSARNLVGLGSVRSDQIWSSDQIRSEPDLKIWPYSLPFEVRKILSGSDQIRPILIRSAQIWWATDRTS